MNPSKKMSKLISVYKNTDIEFPDLKAVSLASWIVESGWGKSDLADKHNNFAGMKYRDEIKKYASKISYNAHDGVDIYCKFETFEKFIKGYWAFLDRKPYDGWRKRAGSAEEFIGFVGPIWAADEKYSQKVINLLGKAERLLAAATSEQDTSNIVCEACGDDSYEEMEKPVVNRWEPTSHMSSRNNVDIDHIVVHYTTSRNIEGTISHFKHGSPRTSAHYIIGLDGALVQMINDSERAWHAGSSAMNARSIGIEHVAALGDKITPAQARTSAALIRWLMREYDVRKEHVIPHVCVKATSCCGDLFGDFGGRAGADCNVQKTALHKWMSSVGI
ncbi:N-acetylmuramoyl-L-alanine amidase [Bosea sp. WAO]|uniref:N-acetylmuramoyl-L-alanine amidase n=1 Tax=Bosea sp. WAO TaxID=406341 RepID=UPI000A926894|nr:N-acetylmuramoyl-L-alanine amidase [Bosea sp. WAO]